MIAPTMFEKKIRSGIEITFVAFEAPTIIPAEHKDPISAKEMPRISSKFQFGPKQTDNPKKAKMNAKIFIGFTEIPSIIKFIIKTQKGNVKKIKTLRLTGMY